MNQRLTNLVPAVLILAGCAGLPVPADAPDSKTGVSNLADRYYEHTLTQFPETPYFSGIEATRHDGLTDNSLAAQARREKFEDELFSALSNIDPQTLIGSTEWITYAYLKQTLSSAIARRVCRTELWNVNHMGGWHSGYTQLAGLQPVGTAELREQSLTRWSRFPAYVDNELANLQYGQTLGYTAPRPVVQRVIDQLDGVLALAPETSPFFSPAERDTDADFAQRTRDLVTNSIHPAIQRYRDYLVNTYLDIAREELSITANPNGEACYEASLRHYTTLERSGREVYELGQATVAANKQAVIELGKAAYGLDDFDAILSRAKSEPTDRFADKEELLEFSRDMVRRAGEVMPDWIATMPTQEVVVVPFPEHEEGTGRSAHYRPGAAERPGEYRIPLHNPTEQRRGNAEATAFHEAWPGHHLQVAVGQAVDGLHPITKILWYSGPGEGWARYSEALAEEMGLYTTTSGPILRRAWPARGMVVDPGIHLFGWTREQAEEYMLESGRFPANMRDQLVDRIAILPGQLTAYDSGGLEILALRREAEAAMGEAFDVREFHDRVLENGTIPLRQLRVHIERWIADWEADRN